MGPPEGVPMGPPETVGAEMGRAHARGIDHAADQALANASEHSVLYTAPEEEPQQQPVDGDGGDGSDGGDGDDGGDGGDAG